MNENNAFSHGWSITAIFHRSRQGDCPALEKWGTRCGKWEGGKKKYGEEEGILVKFSYKKVTISDLERNGKNTIFN